MLSDNITMFHVPYAAGTWLYVFSKFKFNIHLVLPLSVGVSVEIVYGNFTLPSFSIRSTKRYLNLKSKTGSDLKLAALKQIKSVQFAKRSFCCIIGYSVVIELNLKCLCDVFLGRVLSQGSRW